MTVNPHYRATQICCREGGLASIHKTIQGLCYASLTGKVKNQALSSWFPFRKRWLSVLAKKGR